MSSEGSSSGGRLVGRVVRAHGIRGAVLVEVLTSIPEARFAPGSVLRDRDRASTLTVAGSRPQRDLLLVHFDEVSDRTQAEALRGVFLTGVEDLPPPEDEVWADDVIGCTVRSEQGDDYGIVSAVVDGPAHDYLIVKSHDGTEAMVPVVDAILVEIDLETRTVVLDPPEGLL